VGSLRDTPLPRLLVSLQRDGFTGRLVLRRDALEKRFEWRRGAPVGVSSPLAAEQLCEILARDGALAPEARQRVEQTLAERGGSELQALASLGRLAPRTLLVALAEQLRRSLADCLRWRAGDYTLEPQPAAGATPALPFDLLAEIVAALASDWRTDEVLVALGPHATSYPVLAPGFGAPWLPAGPAREALLPRLDGRSPVYALLQELADPACAAALWILDELGALVHHASALAPEPAPQPAEPEPAIEIVVRAAADAAAGAKQAAAESGPAAAARDAAAEALRSEVQALHARLGQITLWEVLGVARDANAAEVRRAYLRSAKRLHPDRLVQIGLADLKDAANEVFAEIARAHEVLSDPEKRRHYEATLGDERLEDAERIAEAEASFRRGDHLLRAGNFRGALEFLERAVALWPEEADYQAALAWALHRKAPAESERAWEHFERALALGAAQPVWLLRASLVARAIGKDGRANELGARARAADPKVKA
jgi:tetratricopeptide (TPR) repeat protein